MTVDPRPCTNAACLKDCSATAHIISPQDKLVNPFMTMTEAKVKESIPGSTVLRNEYNFFEPSRFPDIEEGPEFIKGQIEASAQLCPQTPIILLGSNMVSLPALCS